MKRRQCSSCCGPWTGNGDWRQWNGNAGTVWAGRAAGNWPEPGLYCYESVFECPEAEACLAALSLEQKVRLWMAFLAEDRECVEFQWLYDAIARRILENRIEWELSLYEAMKRLGYSIQADQRRFMLCDGQGRRALFWCGQCQEFGTGPDENPVPTD